MAALFASTIESIQREALAVADPTLTPTVASVKHVQLSIPIPQVSFTKLPSVKTILIVVAVLWIGWREAGKPTLRVPWAFPGQGASVPAPKDAVETAAVNSHRGEAAALEAAAAKLTPGTKATSDQLATALHDARLPLAQALGDALQNDPDTHAALLRAATIKRAYTK